MGLLTKAVAAVVEVGGLYGINVETLTGDKTLTPNVDEIYQYLDPDDVDRVITLDTVNATIGDRFIIKHNSGNYRDINFLDIRVGATTYDEIYNAVFKEWIFDGSNWVAAWTGTGYGTIASEQYRGLGIGRDVQTKEYGVAIGHCANAVLYGVALGISAQGQEYGVAMGYQADGHDQGVAIGCQADGHSRGLAAGYQALGHTESVAVGYQADGANYGTAIGYKADTNDNYYSIALGYQSECTRYAELAVNIDGNVDQYNQLMIGGWAGETADETPAEILCGGVADQRFTMRAESSLTFRIIVNARDNTTGDCATYLFEGLIKRDGAGNTTLSTVTKTVRNEDDATWDCDVTADDVNDALIITVTGDAANIVQWDARIDGIETHF